MSKIQRRGGYLLAALLVLGAVLGSCGKDPVAPPQPVLATPPQLDPPSGDLDSLDVITITCSDPDVVIKYTLDGSDPTELQHATPSLCGFPRSFLPWCATAFSKPVPSSRAGIPA